MYVVPRTCLAHTCLILSPLSRLYLVSPFPTPSTQTAVLVLASKMNVVEANVINEDSSPTIRWIKTIHLALGVFSVVSESAYFIVRYVLGQTKSNVCICNKNKNGTNKRYTGPLLLHHQHGLARFGEDLPGGHRLHLHHPGILISSKSYHWTGHWLQVAYIIMYTKGCSPG